MIRISQLKLPVTHKKSDLEKKIYTTLKISSSDLLSWHIEKKSLDARKKPDLFYVYTIAANVQNEKRIIKKNRNKNITILMQSWKKHWKWQNASERNRYEVIKCSSTML